MTINAQDQAIINEANITSNCSSDIGGGGGDDQDDDQVGAVCDMSLVLCLVLSLSIQMRLHLRIHVDGIITGLFPAGFPICRARYRGQKLRVDF